jgi:hypothetical protein
VTNDTGKITSGGAKKDVTEEPRRRQQGKDKRAFPDAVTSLVADLEAQEGVAQSDCGAEKILGG